MLRPLARRLLACALSVLPMAAAGPVLAQATDTLSATPPAVRDSVALPARLTDHAAPPGNVKPSFRVPRVAEGIRVDGELDEPQWREAVRLSGFTQWNPDNLERPPVETEVLVCYDAGHLHVGIVARDDPGAVRAGLRDRDEIFQDDFVGLFLDPTGTGSWAYELWANPLGVQGDLLWTPTNEDSRFDVVYDSRGRIMPDGYQVEMAIPFGSIRFPEGADHPWRVNFWRNHPRALRGQYSWAAISRGDPCWQCQWGTMTGIENVRRAGNLELLPSVTTSHASVLRDPDDLRSGLGGADLEGDLGLNLRYVFASNLTAEAAVNPDFSQIEADATEIDVNSTFALFYPEKRPFFQEGGDLFQTLFSAVYTRSVNDPSAAARITGRSGRTSLAYVAAVDEHSPHLLAFEERSAVLQGGRSVSNIARLQRAFGSDSRAGLLFTDRRHEGGGSGTMAGVDGSLRFLRTLRLVWQGLLTRTVEPRDSALTARLGGVTFDGGEHTAVFDGERFGGHAAFAGLRRDGRTWNLSLNLFEKSPGFRLENGFETQNDTRIAELWTGFDCWPRNSFFNLVTPNLSVGRKWNFGGLRKDEWLRPELFTKFKGQTEMWVAYLWSNERFRGGEFDGIRRAQTWGMTRFAKPLSLEWEAQVGRFIARNQAEPVLGRGAQVELEAVVKPLSRLVLEPSYRYSVLRHPDTDSTLFEGYILRLRSQYQLTREMFLRVIVQYDDFARELHVDPLLSYKLNPFTAAYAGSAHGYRDDDLGDGFSPVDRQIFVKLQYLFRM